MDGDTLEQRFWTFVRIGDDEDDCWLWLSTTVRGYGQFIIRQGKRIAAHRFAYQLEIGPVPEGLTLDHLCRVRNCVNSWHLEPVTLRENIYRSLESRGYHPHNPRSAKPKGAIVPQRELFPHFLGLRLSIPQRDFVDSLASLHGTSASEVIRSMIDKEHDRLNDYLTGKDLEGANRR